jgi:hypothetical protein
MRPAVETAGINYRLQRQSPKRHRGFVDVRWLANTPIRRKITVLMVLTAAQAHVGAGAALGGYEIITFRRTLAQKLTTVADIVGRNGRDRTVPAGYGMSSSAAQGTMATAK